MQRDISRLAAVLDQEKVGREIHQLIAELYPVHRSITGNGFRKTMRLLRRHIPLKIHEVPTGTRVFDWTVPREWNIRDAYVKDSQGNRVIDFRKSNLHIVAYSPPVKKRMSLRALKKHLYTLPDYPDWIPYRYAYYDKTWGFCLSHNDFLKLEEGAHEVCIDSRLDKGHLTYGEYFLSGNQPEEVLVSSHACHPALCNDNLSGVAVAAILAKSLSSLSLRYSYRFLFLPATIGAVTWLWRNEAKVSRIKHGVVLTGLGDPGRSTYKKSRQGNAEIDRAFIHILENSGQDYDIMDFSPYGSDERQFCSPGFDLPVGCLMRTPPARYREYHTSGDNLDFVRPASLADSFSKCLSVVNILENNKRYINLNPKGEPQLGRRGLYRSLAGQTEQPLSELALLWVLNLSDGSHTLLDIAERSGLTFEAVKAAAVLLEDKELIKAVPEAS
jgi:aminopeptidase-like protein